MENERTFKALANIRKMTLFLEDDMCEIEFEPTIEEMLDMRIVLKCLSNNLLRELKRKGER